MGKPIELTDEFLAAFVKWMVPGMGGMSGASPVQDSR
jgi:hypothetical protein